MNFSEVRVMPVLNQTLGHEDVWGNGCSVRYFLDFDTS
jgi:hypothetical protein